MSRRGPGIGSRRHGFPRVSGDEPKAKNVRKALNGFPRVSGDEPENPANTIGTTKFSPRERG